MEAALGYLPQLEVKEGRYLVDILFKVGPARQEAPITEQDLFYWEQRRGIELAPWQADLITMMSRAYLAETYAAREYDAPCPVKGGESLWLAVKNHKAEKSWDRKDKELARDGDRKRRRDSIKG